MSDRRAGRLPSFATRIAVYFGGLFVFVMAVLGALWYFGAPQLGLSGERAQRLEAATRVLEVFANEKRAFMAQAIEERRGDIIVVAENRTIAAAMAQRRPIQADVERIVERLQRAYPDVYRALHFVAVDTGTIVGSSHPARVGGKFPDRGLLERARQTGVVELLDQVSDQGGETLAITRQIRESDPSGRPDGRVLGLVIAVLDPAHLTERSPRSETVGTAEIGGELLLGSRGQVLFSRPSLDGATPPFAPKVGEIGRFEGTIVVPGVRGGEYVAVFRELPLSGGQSWTIVSHVEVAEALRELTGKVRVFITAGLAGTLLALLAVVVVARRLARPLRELAQIELQFGSGQFAARAPEVVHGDAEVAELARTFNVMAERVEQSQRGLERLVVERTAELAQERDAAQRYLDIARVMILALDREHRIVMINRRGAEIIGKSADELVGQDWFAVCLPPVERGRVSQAFDALMADEVKGVEYFENRILDARGNAIQMAWNNAVVRDADGRPVGVLSCGEDITERKQAQEALHKLTLELERRVAERTAELERSNRELHDTLTRLQHTQDELLQREKLASLGSLVAGIAHELNTPLGNGVMVTTSLLEEFKEFEAKFAAQSLTRREMNSFVERLQHGLGILLRNLDRAHALVGNFKSVAVDQSSEGRRSFDLAETIKAVVETLQPQFKHTPHRIEVDIPAGILVDSYPGPLGQVVTNLLLNSLIHGFDDSMQGIARVKARTSDPDHVALVFSDNGRGIPAANLKRIYDPFFTTRLGQGGSGLGLHIVYNLVNRVLGGSIHVESEPGQGACFEIALPRVAPVPVVDGLAVPLPSTS